MFGPPTFLRPSLGNINLAWLIRLRWGAIAGQILTIGVVVGRMGFPLPLPALGAIVTFEVVTNLGASFWARRHGDVGQHPFALLLALDIACLTGLLFFSGGSFNPFSFLYLVYLTLAAVVLRASWTWALVGLSLVCSAALFFGPAWLDSAPTPEQTHAQHMQMHLEGMWVAFGVAAGFIVYFVTRIRRAIASLEEGLAAERTTALRHEKLASLATLAAGAAHELATPLGTIAVVTREMERATAGDQLAAVDDVRLIRQQVDRCRDILDRMASGAGESPAEALVNTPLLKLVEQAIQQLADADPARPDVQLRLQGAEAAVIHGPRRALTQSIAALLQSARDASAPGVPVIVTGGLVDERLDLVIVDQGAGMDAETARRIGEPFFTTKPEGRGMGLGVFLARTVAEQLGGRLTFDSARGQGTRACLDLPVVPA